MKRGTMRGMIAGTLIGGTAATVFGIVNWQTHRRLNQQMKRGGRWLSEKTEELMKKI